jgi:hypothetical protein
MGELRMTADTKINAAALREEVKKKYREVALEPHSEYCPSSYEVELIAV